jgi:hypothetical protein
MQGNSSSLTKHPHQHFERAGTVDNRFARDEKEPGSTRLGAKKIPGERPRELV